MPAKAMFEDVYDVLDELIRPVSPGGTLGRLGGGTTLAARWRHRRSTDIDIAVPVGTGLGLRSQPRPAAGRTHGRVGGNAHGRALSQLHVHFPERQAGSADPAEFFSRTCFTRALSEHAGMVLRRLAGQTANTAPVLTLITQFGGGKTHTLASLYHIAVEQISAQGDDD